MRRSGTVSTSIVDGVNTRSDPEEFVTMFADFWSSPTPQRLTELLHPDASSERSSVPVSRWWSACRQSHQQPVSSVVVVSVFTVLPLLWRYHALLRDRAREIRAKGEMMADEDSPGLGYWKAADGNWYPPQWEYYWCTKAGNTPGAAIEAIDSEATPLGLQGWEMVNYTLTGMLNTMSVASAFFKRRIQLR
jgi:hypothetical protein